ncbi:MAG: Tetraacyldisaccharide 4'-kinase [Bacteroidetes bacterium ADurb.Bin408]|nr:MAG: Tetraacyldisaccharide 4'-kinase [Bacteroidetes bacterium ADurb.Bin408]
MKQLLKLLLLPFSAIYGSITFIRNKFYDWGWLPSQAFDLPVISIGNISTGGTGKSPAVEYLIRLLQKQSISIATLSRGYGRQTGGYILADTGATAATIGDEPHQFFRKFNDVAVAVCEDRIKGIAHLLRRVPAPGVILLDDAFQHRRVKPGLSILLTRYNNIYSHDFVLPAGRLREFRCGAARADIIIVTKSPEQLPETAKDKIIKSLRPMPNQVVLFSHIVYNDFQPFFKDQRQKYLSSTEDFELLLFTGIADARPLITRLEALCKKLHIMRFGDHHVYSQKDIRTISGKFRNIVTEKKAIVTTEKDFSRLAHQDICNELSDFPVFYIPVEMGFSENDKKIFENKIVDYVAKNQ